MNKTYLLLPLVLLLSCKPKLQPTDEALYEMLNFQYDDYVSRFGNKNAPNALLVKTTRYGINKGDSLSIIKMDTLFTKEDLAYIFEQAKDTTAIVLNPALLKGANTLISQKELDTFWHECRKKEIDTCWREFNRRYGDSGYVFYNKPLFNKKHTVALLHLDSHCGSLCGSTMTLIYRKEKGRWKPIGIINPSSS